MYILKNAMKSILRTKGRNILILIIVFLIAASCCIALSIREAAEKARQAGLDSLQITAQLSVDRQKLMENAKESGGDMQQAFQGAEDLSLDEMKTYAASPYVKDFTYTMTASMGAPDEGLEPVDTTGSFATGDSGGAETAGQTPGGMGEGMGGGQNTPPGGMGNQGDFSVIGYSSYAGMTDFTSGSCSLTEGELFSEDGSDPVCLVSDELAELNGLSVGDTITLVNPNNTDETFAFTLSGIYTNSESGATDTQMRGFSTSSDPANQILTSYNALNAVAAASESAATTTTDSETGRTLTTALRSQTSGSYSFADVDSYNAFADSVYDMGLSDDYSVVSSDLQAYEQSLQPLDNLSSFAGWFLLIVLIVGGAVLIVFNIFNIRERKYEIGVLTAIGMKKGKVLLQFLSEIFLVTFAALLIGSAAGAICSAPVANALLESQTTTAQTSQADPFQPGGQPGMEGDPIGGGQPDGLAAQTQSAMTEITSATDMAVLMQLLGIGVLLTLLSGLAGAAFVMRYEPLKILSSRT